MLHTRLEYLYSARAAVRRDAIHHAAAQKWNDAQLIQALQELAGLDPVCEVREQARGALGQLSVLQSERSNGFIFTNPMPLGQASLMLVHTTTQPRDTPTLNIEFISPAPGEITPQGYVTQTDDPDDDNVDIWGNWDAANAQYAAGELIGNFEYVLEARAPGAATC